MISLPDSKTRRFLALLEFSFNSLSQAYGRTFVRRIVVRHPLRTLRGFVTYCQTLSADRPRERLLLGCGEDEFVKRAVSDSERLLVATGFCQKPLRQRPAIRSAGLRSDGSAQDCPAGRYNHDCLYLSRLELNSKSQVRYPPACLDCSIRVLGHAALEARASFAVLTSAQDIAHDVLIPALEERRFNRVLFAICRYSVEPMSLALLVCGLEGYIFPYESGACADYRQWLRADGGDKPERTTLSAQTVARLLGLLERIAAGRRKHFDTTPIRYEQQNHVFRPR